MIVVVALALSSCVLPAADTNKALRDASTIEIASVLTGNPELRRFKRHLKKA